MPYFSIFNRTPAAPCFKIFNERNPQPHLIFAFEQHEALATP